MDAEMRITMQAKSPSGTNKPLNKKKPGRGRTNSGRPTAPNASLPKVAGEGRTAKLAPGRKRRTIEPLAPDVRKILGRPSIYNPELADAFCALVANGYTINSVLARADMPSWFAICRWQEKYPEFKQKLDDARRYSTMALEEEVLDLAREAQNYGASVSNLRLKAVRWVTSIRNATIYGDPTKQRAVNNNTVILSSAEKSEIRAKIIAELEDFAFNGPRTIQGPINQLPGEQQREKPKPAAGPQKARDEPPQEWPA